VVEKFEDLFDDGVTDLTSYRMGIYRERERILQWIADHDSGRCCFESHDLVAFIKGENK
jgi:hypothetical protein